MGVDEAPSSTAVGVEDDGRRRCPSLSSGLVPDPTLDQEAVRNAVVAGRSLRVVAHAGTGKTTTLLWSLAGHAEESGVLFLEYNRDLRLEAKRAAREAGLAHVSVHNYDSFLLEFYDRAAPSRDFQLALQRVLREGSPPLAPFSFGVVVVDEAQDMTEPYARFLKKILADNAAEAAQLVLAGDPKQSIYAFRGATSQYLVGGGGGTWDWGGKIAEKPEELSLAETFRFGDGLCGFVNGLCSGALFKPAEWGTDIVSGFPGGTVETWRMDAGSRAEPAAALLEAFREAVGDGKKAADVCVLSQSVREENTLLTSFLEQASRAGLAPSEDESSGLPAVLRTVHTSKGRQYRTVFVFLTQRDSWLTPTGRIKAERNTLLYVACTRAREFLHIVQGSDERVLDRIWAKCARRNAVRPRERSAHTGGELPAGQPDMRALPPLDTRFVPAFARSALGAIEKRASVEDKESLLGLLSFGTQALGPALAEPSALEELVVRCRAEWHSTRGGVGALAPLMRWAAADPACRASPCVAYARVARRSLCHLFLESFKDRLTALRPFSTDWGAWASAAAFHPDQRYGHAAAAGASSLSPPRADLCDALYGSFVEQCGHLELITPESRLCGRDISSACSHDHLFFLDHVRRMVVCPVFCATEALRPVDAFAVVLAAGRLGLSLGSIAYLQRGVAVVVRVGPGAAARAEQLVARANQWAAR